MKNEWNGLPGPAVVNVDTVDKLGWGYIAGRVLPPDLLSNLPAPPRAMTEAEAALVDMMIYRCQSGLNLSAEERHLADAVIAERAPHDPVEVAWRQFVDENPEPSNFTKSSFIDALVTCNKAKEKL